ncbi:hypothetical protein N656DRAFT_769295 [Canariomyces notabilis]|uniref:Uncharacterized protein n=1 Tax=Canariomyces notabilis TaxID=2074819 RepID=A0AAN6YRF6_9PEZI|nr:hypothetical protein N656DRAFT_769295 [Canariomyces arenarius]
MHAPTIVQVLAGGLCATTAVAGFSAPGTGALGLRHAGALAMAAGLAAVPALAAPVPEEGDVEERDVEDSHELEARDPCPGEQCLQFGPGGFPRPQSPKQKSKISVKPTGPKKVVARDPMMFNPGLSRPFQPGPPFGGNREFKSFGKGKGRLGGLKGKKGKGKLAGLRGKKGTPYPKRKGRAGLRGKGKWRNKPLQNNKNRPGSKVRPFPQSMITNPSIIGPHRIIA